MDDIQLMTEVGGTGDRKESILLTNLNIVGAIWDTNTNTLVELQPDAKTFNRYCQEGIEPGRKRAMGCLLH